jgi:hypothetical protein
MGARLSSRRWQLSIAAGLTVFIVTIVGGYSGKWHWTGYSGNDTVWDWLQLLLLPVILATAPVWLTKGSGMRRDRQIALAVLVAGFVVLVIVGYAANLHWTGFPGNKLWDWFGLIFLPLSLAAVRAWRKLHSEITPMQLAGIIGVLIAFGLLIAGGYALHWRWTGFQGNTLWDWLQLLLAPVLFGLLVVPAAVSWVSEEIEEHEEKHEEKVKEREEGREAEPGPPDDVRGLRTPPAVQ